MHSSFTVQCKGQYCNVCLEEGATAIPRTLGVTKKSILLDNYENPFRTSDDPLGLKSRNFLSIDYLCLRNPNLHPSTCYNYCKVCKNCELAYSIIDCHRLKHLSSSKVPKKFSKPSLSSSHFQTRLSLTQSNLEENILKFKKKIEEKKNAEYNSIKKILVPVGHSRMSKIAEELLISMNPEYYNKELERKRTKLKIKPETPVESESICQLAQSALKKRVKKLVRLPKEFQKIPKKFL